MDFETIKNNMATDRVTSAADAMLQLSSSFHVHAQREVKPIIVTDSTSQMEDESQLKRARSFVPEAQKDDTYWQKRRKNNEAAKKSREKRRALDRRLTDQVDDLQRDNAELQGELDDIKKFINYPVAVRFNPSIAHLICRRKSDGPLVVQPVSPNQQSSSNTPPTSLPPREHQPATPVVNGVTATQLLTMFMTQSHTKPQLPVSVAAQVRHAQPEAEAPASKLRRTQSETSSTEIEHYRAVSTPPSPMATSTSDVIDLTDSEAEKQDDVTQHLHSIPHKFRLKQALTRRLQRLASEGYHQRDAADANAGASDSDSSGIGSSCHSRTDLNTSSPSSDVTGSVVRENGTLKMEMQKLSDEVKYLKELIQKNIPDSK